MNKTTGADATALSIASLVSVESSLVNEEEMFLEAGKRVFGSVSDLGPFHYIAFSFFSYVAVLTISLDC